MCFSSLPAEHGGDNPPNPEIVGPVITDELGQEKQKLTPEEEKEPLEYQGQIENELNKAGSSEGNMEQTSLRHISFDNF